MTVSSEQSFIEYTGDGTTKTFTIPFYFLLGSDISIAITDTSGSEVVLVYGVNFSVVGDGSPSGGAATLNTAPASGYVVNISRDPPLTQETAYQENGKFPAKSHEKALDKLTMLIQAANHRLDVINSRAIKVPENGNWIAPKIADRNNRLFAWDNDGKAIAVLPQSGSASDVMVQLASTASGKGDALIAVKQPFSGSASRTQHDKNLDIVSVKDFGAVGDGTAHPLSERYATLSAAQAVYSFATSLSDYIDWAALQAACSSGASGVYIPSGCDLNINKTATIPNTNFTLYGCGPSSSIGGSASTLVAFTASEIDPSGNLYTAVVCGIKFKPSVDDAICINASTVWTGSGKAPHSIKGCHFEMKGLRQTGILLSGIWAIKVTGNIFHNPVQSSKVVNGGYGIRFAFTSNMNSSVMNSTIVKNTFTGISYPVYIPPRVAQDGGRAEGINVTSNNMVYGITGLYAVQTLSLNVTSNQVSDFSLSCLHLDGCFGVGISANCELTADNTVITIANSAVSNADNINIVGNRFALQKDGGRVISLVNAYSETVIKGITITGNVFSAYGVSGETYGIFFTGTQPINNIVECGNTFSDIKYGTFFGGADSAASYGANTNIQIGPNVYSLNAGGSPVVFPERMSPTKLYKYSGTVVQTLTAGLTTITVDVTAAKFLEIPVYAEAQVVTSADTRLVYLHDSSIPTQLVFSVKGTAPSAASHRICYMATGISVYGY